jgi:hypothetical protein
VRHDDLRASLQPVYPLERGGVVATLAHAAKAAIVHVVATVTPVAFFIEGNLDDVLDGVTAVAIEGLVSSGQREFRLLVVIEPPARPAVRVVAERAVGGQTAFVVLVRMA